MQAPFTMLSTKTLLRGKPGYINNLIKYRVILRHIRTSEAILFERGTTRNAFNSKIRFTFLNYISKINSFNYIIFSLYYVIYMLCYVRLCYTPLRAFVIFGVLNKPIHSYINLVNVL